MTDRLPEPLPMGFGLGTRQSPVANRGPWRVYVTYLLDIKGGPRLSESLVGEYASPHAAVAAWREVALHGYNGYGPHREYGGSVDVGRLLADNAIGWYRAVSVRIAGARD